MGFDNLLGQDGKILRLTSEHRGRIRRRENQPPTLVEQRLPSRRFQLAPEVVRTGHYRKVLRTLPQSQPGNPGLGVTRAKGVRRVVPVDTKRANPALGREIQRGRSHRSQTDNDEVVVRIHTLPLGIAATPGPVAAAPVARWIRAGPGCRHRHCVTPASPPRPRGPSAPPPPHR